VPKSVARTENEYGEFVGMKRARFVNESKAAISATIARIPFGKSQICSSSALKRFAHKFYELLLRPQCKCLLSTKSSGLNRRNKTPPLAAAQGPDPFSDQSNLS
jgi:hypothetical protein